MNEQDQYQTTRPSEAVPVPPKGLHDLSTLDTPPPPEGIKAFEAMIRKDLRERRSVPPQTDS
jgi:hypothetical protein